MSSKNKTHFDQNYRFLFVNKISSAFYRFRLFLFLGHLNNSEYTNFRQLYYEMFYYLIPKLVTLKNIIIPQNKICNKWEQLEAEEPT